jgi:hypothetical protein
MAGDDQQTRFSPQLPRVDEEGEPMKARQVFIALMMGKGYTVEELAWEGRKFSNPAITTRWNYFLMGWEMRGTQ